MKINLRIASILAVAVLAVGMASPASARHGRNGALVGGLAVGILGGVLASQMATTAYAGGYPAYSGAYPAYGTPVYVAPPVYPAAVYVVPRPRPIIVPAYGHHRHVKHRRHRGYRY